MTQTSPEATGTASQLIECYEIKVLDPGLIGSTISAILAEVGQNQSTELLPDEIPGWLWGIFFLKEKLDLEVKKLDIGKIEIDKDVAYVEIDDDRLITPLLFFCLMYDYAEGPSWRIFSPVNKNQETISLPDTSLLGSAVEVEEEKNTAVLVENEGIGSKRVDSSIPDTTPTHDVLGQKTSSEALDLTAHETGSTDNEAVGNNWEEIEAELKQRGIDTKDFSDYEKEQLCKIKPENRDLMANIYFNKRENLNKMAIKEQQKKKKPLQSVVPLSNKPIVRS